MIGSFPHRRFQLWEYHVSHGSMLIRSPRGPENATTVDLVFVGVEYVSAPRHLRGLELVDATAEDVSRATTAIGRPIENSRVYVLKVGDQRHLVVAVSGRLDENTHDMFDSPFT
jgi:hypothetical protein